MKKPDTDKIYLTELSLKEIIELLRTWGEAPFHSQQIHRWLYKSTVNDFSAMSDLSHRLRSRLAAEAAISTLHPVRSVASSKGNTAKVLFRLKDSNTIEAVSMVQGGHKGKQKRHTICVSTQVGCALGCPFCATGQQGFIRNLSMGEIVDQVLHFSRLGKRPVTHVVFMGMGEPLANYEATMKAVRSLNSPQGFGLGARHITISTSGLVKQIERLAREDLQVGLAVSLHAPDDRLRSELIPLNVRHPLNELLRACQDYFNITGRRVTFEYILFKGLNDSTDHARQLARLLSKMDCHVNLIQASPTGDNRFQPAPRRVILEFQQVLEKNGIKATLRRSLGTDIEAGCGQLKSAFKVAM